MKKIWLIALVIILNYVIVLPVFAEQRMYTITDEDGATNYYQETPPVFKPDGISEYPYEIYLPNEKEPAEYRVHSNYTVDTDACASCHATHTAVGPSLLQWHNPFDVCIACHDGTVSTTYNVDEGVIGATNEPTYGGHFGFNLGDDEASLSVHNVKGDVDIAGAPGGSVKGETIAASEVNVKDTIMWKRTFGCESCHTPHGQGGNARILHPDPNGWATKTKHKDYFVSSSQVDGGYPVYDQDLDEKVTLLIGYPYRIKIIEKGTGADITDEFKVKCDGKDENGSYSYLIEDRDKSISDINYIEGIATIKVRMRIHNYLGQDDEEEVVEHVSGMNTFCGACHVDYNTEDEVLEGNGRHVIMGEEDNRPGFGLLNGEYSKAYRHAVGLEWNYDNLADKKYIGPGKIMMTEGEDEDQQYVTCLTCHFAHGASKQIWETWIQKLDVDQDYWQEATLEEIAGSSALKRLPNMATCEACHQKGRAAEGYAANTGLEDYIPSSGFEKTLSQVGAAYVNDDTKCVRCHSKYTQNITTTIHGQNTNIETCLGYTCHIKDQPVAKCEDCHGPAGNHLEQQEKTNISNPENKSISNQIVICSRCHNENSNTSDTGYDAHRGTDGWQESKHYLSGEVSCLTCHTSHEKNTQGQLLRLSYNALCNTCHDTTWNLDQVMPQTLADELSISTKSHRFLNYRNSQ